MISKYIIVMCAVFLCTSLVLSQDTNRVDVKGFPVAYYTPETGFAFGLFGITSFNWKKDSLNARRSNVTMGMAYTTKNQFLLYLPYSLFLKNDAYRISGELGYYDYVYPFYGVGNFEDESQTRKENFSIRFPRVRSSVYKRMNTFLFLGFRYAYDHYFDLKVEDSSIIESQKLTGLEAGTNSGLGPAFLIDSRDNVFYPRKGWLVDVSSAFDLGKIVSDYAFTRLNVDVANYSSIGKRSVLASNFYYQQNTGNVPFYQLSLLGGGKRLRGIVEGEIRSNYAWQTQVEYRQEFLKNWGFTIFTATGLAAPRWDSAQFKNLKAGYGVGLRYKLNKKDHVNIRLDLGYSNNQLLPYFTIGEAF